MNNVNNNNLTDQFKLFLRFSCCGQPRNQQKTDLSAGRERSTTILWSLYFGEVRFQVLNLGRREFQILPCFIEDAKWWRVRHEGVEISQLLTWTWWFPSFRKSIAFSRLFSGGTWHVAVLADRCARRKLLSLKDPRKPLIAARTLNQSLLSLPVGWEGCWSSCRLISARRWSSASGAGGLRRLSPCCFSASSLRPPGPKKRPVTEPTTSTLF